jgi:hypothetical protein
MFHMTHDGETTIEDVSSLVSQAASSQSTAVEAAFISGVVVGLLIGEGHFGGDGKQPQVTLRMHVRHEPLFRWLLDKIPGSKLYGPYNHGGREYYQWMVRGELLRSTLIPLLDALPLAQIDPYVHDRYQKMKERYRLKAGG